MPVITGNDSDIGQDVVARNRIRPDAVYPFSASAGYRRDDDDDDDDDDFDDNYDNFYPPQASPGACPSFRLSCAPSPPSPVPPRVMHYAPQNGSTQLLPEFRINTGF